LGRYLDQLQLCTWNYDAAMVVVLPDEDSTLQAFVDDLTPDTWQTWSGQFRKHDGFLELPRFEISQQRNSRLVLEKMGMTLPFSSLSTFVPLVGPEGAKLTRVQEGASMKVDETGAELVSYGVIGGAIGGICVNRPFFFWIVDTLPTKLCIWAQSLNLEAANPRPVSS